MAKRKGSPVRARRRQDSEGLAFLGAMAAATAAILYLYMGEWGQIPGINMSRPSALWARVVFFPGLQAGYWSYDHVFKDLLPMKSAMNWAGIVGIVAMGFFGGCAGCLWGFLKKR